jgi:hypothetical protein
LLFAGTNLKGIYRMFHDTGITENIGSNPSNNTKIEYPMIDAGDMTSSSESIAPVQTMGEQQKHIVRRRSWGDNHRTLSFKWHLVVHEVSHEKLRPRFQSFIKECRSDPGNNPDRDEKDAVIGIEQAIESVYVQKIRNLMFGFDDRDSPFNSIRESTIQVRTVI